MVKIEFVAIALRIFLYNTCSTKKFVTKILLQIVSETNKQYFGTQCRIEQWKLFLRKLLNTIIIIKLKIFNYKNLNGKRGRVEQFRDLINILLHITDYTLSKNEIFSICYINSLDNNCEFWKVASRLPMEIP